MMGPAKDGNRASSLVPHCMTAEARKSKTRAPRRAQGFMAMTADPGTRQRGGPMAADVTAMLSVTRGRDLRRQGPSVRARLLIYGAAWLPPLALLFTLFPPIDAVFQRLVEEKALPKV